jgi:hypothetical protein
MTNRTAPEIIAYHLGWDIADLHDYRYQSTRYANPSVYALESGYYTCPQKGKIPTHDMGAPWRMVGEYYGRKVFRSSARD